MATWYDHPQYFEMVFRDETAIEVEFFEAAFEHYAGRKIRRVFEPGCGGGRLVVAMSAAGYDATGLDLSPAMVRYANRQLKRRDLPGCVIEGDMTDFSAKPKYDAVFCTFNTFRHLMEEKQVEQHFRCVADSLNKGGLYILGFHLIPPDAEEAEIERYRAKHGGTQVSVTLRVTQFDRKTRREDIKINVKATKRSGKIERIVSEFPLRLYDTKQVKRMMKKIQPDFEWLATHDFGYDLEETRDVDDDLADALFILRKR
ncbi:MAG: class I SAM-dependent methyltransferase [Planctomycetota bacterium]